MRIKIIFSKNNESVPNNVSVTNSWLHKCLGSNNEYHDSPSNYCVTRLSGGVFSNGGRTVEYPNGGYVIISGDTEILNSIVSSMDNVDMGYGMKFSHMEFMVDTVYDGYNFFHTMDTGILLRSFKGNGVNINHTLNDEDYCEVLTKHTIKRLKTINPKLNFKGFKIEMPKYVGNNIKRTFVKNTPNITSVGQFLVHSNKDVATAILNYGLGQSTGSGFGTVFKTENRSNYGRIKKM